MKHYMALLVFSFLVFCTLPAFGQDAGVVVDTAAVRAEVDSLLKVSRDLTGKREFDKALEVNAEAERLALEHFGRESAGYAKVCNLNGLIAYYKNNLGDAEKWWLESKAIREKVLGKEHPDFASSLNNLGNLYKAMGDYDKAEKFHLETKIIREKSLGREHPAYATCLYNIANLYTEMGAYLKAEPYYLESKAIIEKISNKNHPEYISILKNIGILYEKMGTYTRAVSIYFEAKNIVENTIGKENSEYAGILSNLGAAYYYLGDYEKAEMLFLEGKMIQEKTLGDEHPDYVRSLNNLGNLYGSMGIYEKSKQILIQAKNIQYKISGTNNELYTTIINNLGILYIDIGAYEESEKCFLFVKEIRERTFGKVHPDYASCLDNLGAIYKYLGIYDKSELYFLESKDIRRLTLGELHPDYAMSLNNLGVLYSEIGVYDKAELHHLEAKKIRELIGVEHPNYAASLINLGVLYTDMRAYEKVENLYLEAKKIFEKTIGKEHPDYASTLFNLGGLYMEMCLYDKVSQLFFDAKAILEKVMGKEHPDYAKSLKTLAILYEFQSRHPSSDTLLTEFHPLKQSLQSKAITYLSERDLAAYAATFQSDGDNLASYISNRLAKNHPTSILPALSYDHNLFQKGFLLGATTRLNTLASATPESEETMLRLKGYRRRLAAQYALPIAERKNVPELEAKANSLEKVLVRTVAGFGEALRQVQWQEVRDRLQPGEAAIEFVHFRYYDHKARATDSTLYAALVLLPSDTAPRFVPLCEARQIEAVINQKASKTLYHQKIYDADASGNPSLLYPLVWAPLVPHLQGVKTIYFSPSGLLHRLNLGAIQPAQGQTLAGRYRLVGMGSTRNLVVPPTVAPAGNTAAVFGGIRYDMDSTKIAAANDSLPELGDMATRGGSGGFAYTDSTLRVEEWKHLPATDREAAAIDALLKKHGFQTTIRRGHTATEEAVQHIGRSKEPSPRVLHIATHGFFFPDPKPAGERVSGEQVSGEREPTFKISDNPMIRAGLLLAGANHAWKTGKPLRSDLEDGILTAYEISQMNLRHTELVVLSACETGLGQIEGNEGVYGLQRAFKIAGAKYLLMSLWKVPDSATQELMTAYYEKWLEEKMPIPDAFRAAQEQMRAKYENPYYWAGFVLVE